MAAATTDQQARQHARPVLGSRQGFPQMAVLRQFLLVFLELVPRDVRRETLWNQHAALLMGVERATGVGTSRVCQRPGPGWSWKWEPAWTVWVSCFFW